MISKIKDELADDEIRVEQYNAGQIIHRPQDREQVQLNDSIIRTIDEYERNGQHSTGQGVRFIKRISYVTKSRTGFDADDFDENEPDGDLNENEVFL